MALSPEENTKEPLATFTFYFFFFLIILLLFKAVGPDIDLHKYPQ